VLPAPACYFTVLAAGKKLIRRFPVVFASWKKEKRQSFVVTN